MPVVFKQARHARDPVFCIIDFLVVLDGGLAF